MLDAASPLPVPGVEVLAWADLDSVDVVWALPARPRLALAADGGADASLMLYRRGAGSPPDGGQLSLTVDLALSAGEREAAAAAGAARRPAPTDPDEQRPPVEVRTPQWLDATVHAELLPGLTVDGRPTLMGDNTCMLTVQLDATQAAGVQDAWADGFPEATVELRGTVDGTYSAAATATVSAKASATTTSTTTNGASCDSGDERHERQASITVAAAATNSVGVALRLHGPLRLPAEARTTRLTDLTL